MAEVLLRRDWMARRAAGLPGWELGVASEGPLIDRLLGIDPGHGDVVAEPGDPMPLAVTVLRMHKDGGDRVAEMRRWCRRHLEGEAYLLICEPWVRAFFQRREDAAVFRMFFDDRS